MCVCRPLACLKLLVIRRSYRGRGGIPTKPPSRPVELIDGTKTREISGGKKTLKALIIGASRKKGPGRRKASLIPRLQANWREVGSDIGSASQKRLCVKNKDCRTKRVLRVLARLDNPRTPKPSPSRERGTRKT